MERRYLLREMHRECYILLFIRPLSHLLRHLSPILTRSEFSISVRAGNRSNDDISSSVLLFFDPLNRSFNGEHLALVPRTNETNGQSVFF